MGRAGNEAVVDLAMMRGGFEPLDDLRDHLYALLAEAAVEPWISDPASAEDEDGELNEAVRAQHERLMEIGAAVDSLVEAQLEAQTEGLQEEVERLSDLHAEAKEKSVEEFIRLAAIVIPHLAPALKSAGVEIDDALLAKTIQQFSRPDGDPFAQLPHEWTMAWLEVEEKLSEDPVFGAQSMRWQEAELEADRHLARAIDGARQIHKTRRQIALAELRNLRTFELKGYAERHAAGDSSRRALSHIERFFPQDWLQASTEFGGFVGVPLQVVFGSPKEGQTRQTLYNYLENTIYIRPTKMSTSLALSATAHELAHQIIFARPALRVAERAFYERRTRGGSFDGEQQPLLPLNDIDERAEVGVRAYHPSELGREGDFPDSYMGSVNGEGSDAHYELLTVGFEDFVTDGRVPPVLYRDADFRRFFYGALAAL